MSIHSEEQAAADGGSAAALRLLNGIALLPLHGMAEARNQSMPSFLHEITGLSKARISQGNLDAIRPSTLRRINEHIGRLLGRKFSNPAELEKAQKHMEMIPRTSSGKYGPWSGFIHQLEFLPHIPLPISKAAGVELDDFLEALVFACVKNDLESFKLILHNHMKEHSAQVGEVLSPTPVLELESWLQVTRVFVDFSDTLYLDVISALDAEWSSHYFSGRQSMPLFPLVMVRPQDGLLKQQVATSRKNLFFRPSRRLLEFLYALAVYSRYKKWPDKPPSPSKLASILYRPQEQESLNASVVSSYFDGSTKLTLDLVCEHWEQLMRHFLPERANEAMPPYPMIFLALHWQSILIQDNGKSFMILDLDQYNTLWRHYRKKWDLLEEESGKDSIQPSHKKTEIIEWPAWMLSQPS